MCYSHVQAVIKDYVISTDGNDMLLYIDMKYKRLHVVNPVLLLNAFLMFFW